MEVSISVSQEVENKLASEAQRLGFTFSDYIKHLLIEVYERLDFVDKVDKKK